MRTTALGFILGVVLFHHLAILPDPRWLWITPLFLGLLWFRGLRFPAACALGLLWSLWRATLVFDTMLAPELESQDIILSGSISDIPRFYEHQVTFTFRPDTLEYQGKNHPPPALIRLTWYLHDRAQAAQAADLGTGQRWRFQVRLKPLRTLSNPGVQDQSGWQFASGLSARGYVRTIAERQSLAPAWHIGALRHSVWLQLKTVLKDYPQQMPLISALVIGERQGISPAQWETLKVTGTIHLMAISGLHIGWIAVIGGILGKIMIFIINLIYKKTLIYLNKQLLIGIIALLFAFLYAFIAGFSIPTQRAFIMIATLTLTQVIMTRHCGPTNGLILALLLILLWLPAAVLSAGLWLSFSAVALILYTFSYRQKLLYWLKVHIIIALGLIPTLLAWFGQIPWLSPFANVLAVPWVGFLIIPQALLGTFLLELWPSAGVILLKWSAANLELMWQYLEFIQNKPLSVSYLPKLPLWMLLCAFIGILIILLPRGFPSRWTGIAWLLPIFLYTPPSPAPHSVWFTLLDVGQGLASVIRTQHHTLIYDAGPRLSAAFDAGEKILIPFLHAQGITHIDKLILSHSDLDHSGGAPALLARFPVKSLFSGTPSTLNEKECQRGQAWHWDGVDFEILHPPAGNAWLSTNNRSCVLRVRIGDTALLLTGDIEADMERNLVRSVPTQLPANILLAPHHGSRTSSSIEFLNAVKPQYGLFSAGWRNRFGFPRPDVVARYEAVGAQLYNTADSGALSFVLTAQGVTPPQQARQQNRRFFKY
jgi:competence protein ComEC